MIRTRSLVVCALLLVTAPALAQRDANVPDPDPELERKTLQVPDGFEVSLFAADPLLAKPIQMNFDPAGRLWVACSEVYPQIKPGQKANDKVLILEDTKGAGKADKVTVFADGLLIPTAVAPGDGGAYVADSTDMLFLSDPDENGKARKRRVVLSGFGTEDTHHIVHTFRWGPDGMLYFNQSVYIHSHIETPYGPRHLNAGGIWQFRPETMRLEVFCRGFWNTWGHHFDRWGQSFATDGANGEGITYVVPGASYPAAHAATRILNGLNPGSPKHCGLEIVSGRHLPDDWQGNMITNDFRGHRVCRFVVREDGSGYASQEKAEVIKSNHPAFRPIDVKMGPDGAIYIADWYNPIIQHGEVDFRDPRRDLTHGRIWRVTAKDRPLVPRPKLVEATTEELLEAPKAPEDWTRQNAKRVLKERGSAKVLPALNAWTAKLDAAPEALQLEALWTYQSLDVVEPKLLTKLLTAKDHHVRAAATRVIAYWHDRLTNPLELLAARVADEHPQVRLEAVRSLGQVADPRAAEIALTALERPMDRFLDYGLWLTLRDLQGQWLPALQAAKLDFGGNPRHLVFALQAAGAKEGVKPLVDLIRSGKLAKDREDTALTLLASLGGPAELGLVFDKAMTNDGNSASRQTTLLASLEQAAQERKVQPAGDLARLADVVKADNEALRSVALRLAGLWHMEALRPQVLEAAKSAESKDAIRQAAFDALVLLGGPASRDTLNELADGDRPVSVRRMAIVGLATMSVEVAAPKAVALLAAEPSGANADAIFAAFLQRKNGSAVLAKALAEKKLPADVAKIGVRTAQATGRDEKGLIDALTKAGNLTVAKRELSAQEMQAFVADVQKLGDPARGERLYRRAELACLKCHAIGGAGGQVGPDMTSLGASAPVDYLVESILLPSKKIKENYNTIAVETKAGQVITGIKVRESKDELVLRNADDKETVIRTRDIEDKVNVPISLMPEGLADGLTRAELVDLTRFLSELGKVGPYAIGQARVVRRWQTLDASKAVGDLLRRERIAAATGSDPALTWGPAYSLVSGSFPLDDLPKTRIWNGTPFLSVVRCQLDVTTPGKAKLRFNSAQDLTLWLDGNPVDAKEDVVLDLTTGLHTLTVAIDRDKRKEALRVELEDVAGSPARVRIMGGK
jgi:putative heme-binding domain-containing protein